MNFLKWLWASASPQFELDAALYSIGVRAPEDELHAHFSLAEPSAEDLARMLIYASR